MHAKVYVYFMYQLTKPVEHFFHMKPKLCLPQKRAVQTLQVLICKNYMLKNCLQANDNKNNKIKNNNFTIN